MKMSGKLCRKALIGWYLSYLQDEAEEEKGKWIETRSLNRLVWAMRYVFTCSSRF